MGTRPRQPAPEHMPLTLVEVTFTEAEGWRRRWRSRRVGWLCTGAAQVPVVSIRTRDWFCECDSGV